VPGAREDAVTVFARPQVRWRRHCGPPAPHEPCHCQAWGVNQTGGAFIAQLMGLDVETFDRLAWLVTLFAEENR
jgi:hypothetical protein